MQYIDGVLHVRWPFEGEPEEHLEEAGVTLPESAFIHSLDPGYSLEIAVGDVLADDLADLVHALFRRLLAPDDEVLSSIEQGR